MFDWGWVVMVVKKSKSKKRLVKLKLGKVKLVVRKKKVRFVDADALVDLKLLEIRAGKKSKSVLKREQEILGFCKAGKKAWV